MSGTVSPRHVRANGRAAFSCRPVDEAVYAFMVREGIPGLTLAVVRTPYITRVVGYGMSDIREGRPAGVKTLWPAGPLSQGFTAVAVMQLIDRGMLALDDELSRFLPELPVAWHEITLRQLMEHSAGLADYRMRKGFNPADKYSPDELIALVAGVPLDFRPGAEVRRSATNFLLLAEVVEKVAGMPYREFVRRNQIDPLGLQQTCFGADLSALKQEKIALTGYKHESFRHDPAYIDPAETPVGYAGRDGRTIEAAPLGASMKGFADLWASAGDIGHWAMALLGDVLIAKPEIRSLLAGPAALRDGRTVPAMAGWQYYARPALGEIKGGVPGYSLYLGRITDVSEPVSVTLMANREGVDLTGLARSIAAAFDDAPPESEVDERLLYTCRSLFGVDETIERIERELAELEIPVFARFDHARNAQEAEMELRPVKVVVFGAPITGTKLMQENPFIAIELPLRIAVLEDKSGGVRVAFPQMRQLAATYGLTDGLTVGNMQRLLERIVRKAVNAYEP